MTAAVSAGLDDGRIERAGLRRLEPGPHRRPGLRRHPRAARRRPPRRADPAAPRRPTRPSRRRRHDPQRGAALRRRPAPGDRPPLLGTPMRSSAMRALGAYLNIFAIESFIDELAGPPALDPVRLPARPPPRPAGAERGRGRRRLGGMGRTGGERRARARVRPLQGQGRLLRRGRRGRGGVGGARAPADRRRRPRPGRQPRRRPQPARGGRDPGHQLDHQGAGALRPAPDHQRTGRPTRFCGSARSPRVEVHLVDSDPPSVGAGEAAQGPTAAAIGNAVHPRSACASVTSRSTQRPSYEPSRTRWLRRRRRASRPPTLNKARNKEGTR